VDVHQRVELRFGHVGEHRKIAVPGIVDEVVEIAALPIILKRHAQPLSEIAELRNVATVELQRNRLAAHCPAKGRRRPARNLK